MSYPEPVLDAADLNALYNTLQPLGWDMEWIAKGISVGEWMRDLAIPDLYALISTLEPIGWVGIAEYAKYLAYTKEKANAMIPWILAGVGVSALVGLEVGKRR